MADIKNKLVELLSGCSLDTEEDVWYVADKLIAADVSPVVHGRWVNNADDYPECNRCGYMPQYDPVIDDIYYSNYCPDCGARMDGE